jgi:hypothetical protein
MLKHGTHTFPFSFNLPHDIPGSFWDDVDSWVLSAKSNSYTHIHTCTHAHVVRTLHPGVKKVVKEKSYIRYWATCWIELDQKPVENVPSLLDFSRQDSFDRVSLDRGALMTSGEF